MSEIIATFWIGAIVGFLACAFFAGSRANDQLQRENDAYTSGYQGGYANGMRDGAGE